VGGLVVAALLAVHGSVMAQSEGQPRSTSLFPEEVVAEGKGVRITRSELEDMLVTVKANMASQGRTLNPAETDTLEKQLLLRMVTLRLVLNKATDADRAKGAEAADKRIAQLRERASSPESFRRQLRASGLTETRLRKQIMDDMTAETVVERETGIVISEADVRQCYETNGPAFEVPEMVRAAHILKLTINPETRESVSDDQKKAAREKMEDLLKQIRGGTNFARLASENSDDPQTREQGGEMRPIVRGQLTLPELEMAAFSLATNQVSDIITTSIGYHIVKVLDHQPKSKVEFTKVSTNIRDALRNEQLQKKMTGYGAKLRAEADVKILDPSLVLPPDAMTNPKP
jgi:peptidyl-prolyl cis-trans isomerase C